ncbi:hypothetical protein [Bacillus tuaregi]|uniref:hypothetical protein n=1 Tax=Bacillus tuaregi TaxID=1816695 RepID=UPI0008F94DDE|nr:hypothetical protein [Bacillus tuaregi]
MKPAIPIVGLIITIILLIYLESPYSLINKDHVTISSIPNEVIRAEIQGVDEGLISEPAVTGEESNESGTEDIEGLTQEYMLEMILEDKTIRDDYTVETFREYEIYKNEQGEVIKKVPTSNFDFIRYYNR